MQRPTTASWTSSSHVPHPWKIENVVVAEDPDNQSAVLVLTGEVFRAREDTNPAAGLVSRLQVGEAIETPLVFWTVLLMWPAASIRQRLVPLALGLPVFLALEACTTACQLVHYMAEASAMVDDSNATLTAWEQWSRFLEAGGGFVLTLVAALMTIAAASALRPHPRLSQGTC